MGYGPNPVPRRCDFVRPCGVAEGTGAVQESRSVACERCGANVPLVSSTHARCVYCLHDQKIPADVAQAVHADQALEAKLEDAAGSGERAFTKMFVANRGWQVGLAAFTFLSCLPTFYLGFSAEGDTADQLLRAGLYGGAALGSALMAAIPLLWLRTLKRSGEQAFAALPLARVSVDAGAFVAGCPSCGARLNTGGEVAVVCGHCQTQSLLPQLLVDARMKGRHKRVIELRLAGQTAAHGAAQHAVTQWQKKFVPMIIGINVLVGIVIFAAVIAYQLAKP